MKCVVCGKEIKDEEVRAYITDFPSDEDSELEPICKECYKKMDIPIEFKSIYEEDEED